MKRLLLALFIATAAWGATSAQEVYISYGAYTQMDAINCHKGFSDVNKAWGSINIGLYLPVSKTVSIGPSYSYSSAFTPGQEYSFEGLGTYNLKSKVGYHTIMLNAKAEYYRNSIVKLYGHAGVGAVISNMMPKYGDSYNKGYFAFQISPVCAEVNFLPNAAVFGELGFGAQGLIQIGAKYSF